MERIEDKKQLADDTMGHILDTHLLNYLSFQIKDLASAFDETPISIKVKDWRKIIPLSGSFSPALQFPLCSYLLSKDI